MEKDYFTHRRSVRKFSGKEIAATQLEDIIRRAMKAPTCGNMQLYSVVATKDGIMKGELAQLHFNQPASTGANVILTVCADFNRFNRWCRLRNAQPGFDNFHSFITALTDAVIFAQQIVTIAETEGIGTCYLGTVNYNASQISDLLKLPEGVVPVASVAMGYPAEEGEETDRLPLDAVLHMEKYRDDSDEAILGFYSEKENLEENIRFVKENGKTSLAQVFTDIRYPGKMNWAVSESFANLIKEKGFC